MAAPISMTAMAAMAAAQAAPAVPTASAATPMPAPTPVMPATPVAPAIPVAVAVPRSPVVEPMPMPMPAPAPAPVAPGPPDPLAEAGEVVWYVRPPSGGQYGPAASNVMRGWIQEGRVSADSLVWREGWRDWQEAGIVFPQLVQGVGVPASPAVPAAPAPPGAAPRIPPRRRSSTTQAVVIALLVLAVVILGVVFAWVLMHTPAAPPDAKPTAMLLGPDRMPGTVCRPGTGAFFGPEEQALPLTWTAEKGACPLPQRPTRERVRMPVPAAWKA